MKLESPFPLAVWGDKNWPPSLKVKQIENSQNKMGIEGYKWSGMYAPSTQTPLFGVEDIPLSHY